MNTSLSIFLTLIVNAAATVCCAALCMLLLWQDFRRRSNQLFALTMFVFAVYSANSLLMRFNYLFNYRNDVILYSSVSLYGLGCFALFTFLSYFARLNLWARRLIIGGGALLAVVLIAVMWQGAFYTDITVLADRTIGYSLTPLGIAGLFIVVAYQLISVALIYFSHTERSRELWGFALLLPLEAVVSAIPGFQGLPLDTLAMLIIALATARIIMYEHVAKPMTELNKQLVLANQNLMQANQFKAQFLANMSHELRTPLNSIIGYTDLVSSGLYGPLTQKQIDRLEKIARNGRRLLALINDVLDLSKIEAGHMILNREPILLDDALTPVLALVRPDAEKKDVALICEYRADLPPLHADIIRLEQILFNVLSNAVRFTPSGSVTLRAHPVINEVTISVTDTGIGIPLDRQEAIFDSFTQDEDNFVGRTEGTGLGLVVTRHLVQMHGGQFWFTSDGIPGKGSTFYISIPAAEHFQSIRPGTGLLGPTILCIDDNHESVEVLQGMLESEGYRIYGAGSGEAGLQRAHEIRPELILLDITMPGMDGWQVLEALRADPRTARIPVIVMASADPSAKAHQVGTAGSLTKPFQRAELIAQVRNALQVAEKA